MSIYVPDISIATWRNIPDLNFIQASLGVLVDIYVDGKMCVDVSHLVLEALGDTNDQVVDESADCAEGSDVLSGTVVQFDLDNILLGVREVDSQVVKVLGELSCKKYASLDLVLVYSIPAAVTRPSLLQPWDCGFDAYLVVLRQRQVET
jgi:hypothetical protein